MVNYVGSKHRIAKQIIQYYPSHKIYVEPFGGSGSMFFYKQISEKEVYNDINQHMANLFRVLRSEEKTQKLIRMFKYVVNSTDFALEAYHNYNSEDLDDITRAFYTIYMLESGRGMFDKYACLDGVRTLSIKGERIIKKIEAIYNRFKNVVIENVDWKDCFSRYDSKDTFFYCDPPYIVSTSKLFYKKEFQHEELINTIQICNGMVIISNYENELYNERLKDWKKVCFKRHITVNIAGNNKKEQIEAIWIKPNCLARTNQMVLDM